MGDKTNIKYITWNGLVDLTGNLHEAVNQILRNNGLKYKKLDFGVIAIYEIDRASYLDNYIKSVSPLSSMIEEQPIVYINSSIRIADFIHKVEVDITNNKFKNEDIERVYRLLEKVCIDLMENTSLESAELDTEVKRLVDLYKYRKASDLILNTLELNEIFEFIREIDTIGNHNNKYELTYATAYIDKAGGIVIDLWRKEDDTPYDSVVILPNENTVKFIENSCRKIDKEHAKEIGLNVEKMLWYQKNNQLDIY